MRTGFNPFEFKQVARAYSLQMGLPPCSGRDEAADWLREKHRIRLGDVALVQGWDSPVEILVESVEFAFDTTSVYRSFLVVLRGPAIGGTFPDPECHVVYMSTKMSCTEPSAQMRAKFGDRLAKHEQHR